MLAECCGFTILNDMKYKLFEVYDFYDIDTEINKGIELGYEFVQVVTEACGEASSKHGILMRIPIKK